MNGCCNGVEDCHTIKYLRKCFHEGDQHVIQWFIRYLSAISAKEAYEKLGRDMYGRIFKFSMNFKEEPSKSDELEDIMKRAAYNAVRDICIDMGDGEYELYVTM